ncbi:MAG: hypothetical protein QOJ56_4754 [Mycobacterium sp.]|nr:hypothetical protein [Mycobacterium sp.]
MANSTYSDDILAECVAKPNKAVQLASTLQKDTRLSATQTKWTRDIPVWRNRTGPADESEVLRHLDRMTALITGIRRWRPGKSVHQQRMIWRKYL